MADPAFRVTLTTESTTLPGKTIGWGPVVGVVKSTSDGLSNQYWKDHNNLSTIEAGVIIDLIKQFGTTG